MRTIQELTDTKTDTANIAGITPEVWSQTVEAQAENIRVARNFCKISRALQGRPGDVDHVLKKARLTATSDVESGKTEAGTVTFYALDDYGSLDLTPAPYYSSVRIADEVVEEVQTNIIQDANELIAEALAQKEDVAILTAVAAVSSPNAVYGGDASSAGTLDTGDTITTDLVADALMAMRVDRYGMDPRKCVLFISPYQENVFLKDSQFVNAAEYGSDKIIHNGEIGDYLGVKIVVTNNIPTNTPNSGTGHTCLLWEVGKGPVLSVKQDIRVEVDRNVQYQAWDIVGRISFAAGGLYANAICLVEVTDA